MKAGSSASRIDQTTDKLVTIGGFHLASQFLRRSGTRQAGFNAALVKLFPQRNVSILFSEGEAHRQQRSAVARFFAPRTVSEQYRELMASLSAQLVTRFRDAGTANLDDMTLALSVGVAAKIVGLTDSLLPGLGRRLDRFFTLKAPPPGAWIRTLAYIVRAQSNLLLVYVLDVRPALRNRRRCRQDDLISHLLDSDWSRLDILTECVTYATAGMSTTREFLVVAAWHLLDDDGLRRRFLEADEAGRIRILEEIVRLEPPVGTLYRQTEQAIRLDDAGRPIEIPADTRVAIDIRAVNADESVVGRCPHRLDEDRSAQASGRHMSFGDGAHICPGSSLALQEAAIFLDDLLRVPGVKLAQAPTQGWNEMTTGYVLRGATITCDRADATLDLDASTQAGLPSAA